MKAINIDDALIESIINATSAGFQMVGVKPEAIGISRQPPRSQEISSVIGMVGRRTGTVSLNISPRGALFVSNAFSGLTHTELHEEVLDAIAELTNIIAGRIKAELGRSAYGIDQISCPSIIIGGDYRMYHFHGFDSASIEFLIPEMPTMLMFDRFFSVTISLSRK